MTILLHGIKWAILVSQSTTTKIESKALELGRVVMKPRVFSELAIGVITHTDDDKEP
jgi:hypothetical protein